MVNVSELQPVTEREQWFSVRISFTHYSTGKTFERITLWHARTPEEALLHAQEEADRYCLREAGAGEEYHRSEPEIVQDANDTIEMQGTAQHRLREESHRGQ